MLIRNQGFGLVQLLVANLIFALGVMGLVAIQINNQKQVFTGYEQTKLGLYAQDIQARLNANLCNINPHTFEDVSDLNEFIQERLTPLLEKILQEWQADSKANLQSSLEVLFEPVDGKTSKLEILATRASWEFNLNMLTEINFINTAQKLIVEYLPRGCI